eukprot:3995179-Pleurochrysis_carterae.AAC.1
MYGTAYSALLAADGDDHARDRRHLSALEGDHVLVVSRLPLLDLRRGWALRAPPLPELRRQMPLLLAEI